MGKWVFFVVFRFKLDVFIHGYFNPEFPLDDFLKQSKKDRFIYKILSRKIHLDLDYNSEIFRDHEKQKRKWCLTDSVSCSTSEDVRGTQRDFGDQDAKAKYQNWSFEYVLLVFWNHKVKTFLQKNNALALRQPRPLVEDSCPSWSHHPPQIFKLTSAYDPLQTLPVRITHTHCFFYLAKKSSLTSFSGFGGRARFEKPNECQDQSIRYGIPYSPISLHVSLFLMIS